MKSISFNVENSSLVISLISTNNPLVMDNRHLILLMGDAGVAGMYHEVAPLHCFTFTTSRPRSPHPPPTHPPIPGWAPSDLMITPNYCGPRI